MRKIFIIFLIGMMFLNISAQEPIYFNKRIDHYNNKDNARNIIETDTGYIIGAYTRDPDPYYDYDIKLTFTGLTLDGEETLFKEYGYDSMNIFLGQPGSLIKYSEDKYISVGTWRIFLEDFVDSRGMLACYDVNFDTLWTRLYGEKTLPHDTAFMLDQIKTTSDNGFIMTGHRNPGSSKFHLWLLKTDSVGNMQWETFIGDGVEYYSGYSVVQTSDGGYVAGGYKFKIGVIGTGDPLIIKTDSLGNEEWRINPGNPNVDDNKVMVALAEDGNIIAGTNYGTQSSGDNQWMKVKLMKITPEGDILWDFNYGEPGYDKFLLNTTLLENGDIITNGVISLFGDDDPWETSWILCVDSLGTELWYKEYNLLTGKNSFNELHHVIGTSDNGLIGCGMVSPVMPYDTGTTDIWVMKMDSIGCLVEFCDTTVDVISYFENEGSGFSIYPNPAKDEITISMSRPCENRTIVTFYNLYGVKVDEIEIPENSITLKLDLTSWNSGIYVAILMKANQKKLTRKFVVKK